MTFKFLRPEHFVDPIHTHIYRSIARAIDAGRLADAVTMKAEFEHSGILDEVGGTAYLAQLLTAMVGIINAGEYGRAQRDRQRVSGRDVHLAADAHAPVDQIQPDQHGLTQADQRRPCTAM